VRLDEAGVIIEPDVKIRVDKAQLEPEVIPAFELYNLLTSTPNELARLYAGVLMEHERDYKQVVGAGIGGVIFAANPNPNPNPNPSICSDARPFNLDCSWTTSNGEMELLNYYESIKLSAPEDPRAERTYSISAVR